MPQKRKDADQTLRNRLWALFGPSLRSSDTSNEAVRERCRDI